MSKNVKNQQTALEQKIIQLPIAGVTSGRQLVSIPFAVDNYAIINSTPATLYIVEGEEYSKPGVYTAVQPFTYISAPFTTELQKITVFWETTTLVQAGENLIQFMFANEEIRLQVGNVAPPSIATNVNVSNFPVTQPLPTGASTEITLAALLAKVIAAPSTAANQATLIAKDFATQTTLAALLAKVIAAPSTEAKQDSLFNLFKGDSFVNFTAANAGTQVKPGAGVLKKVTVNDPGTTMVISLYDATSATNPIAIIKAVSGTLIFDVAFTTGLYAVVSGGAVGNLTISYQ